jgi:5'-deoxynucleotidase YfbR-like HD superfamily hydrolase
MDTRLKTRSQRDANIMNVYHKLHGETVGTLKRIYKRLRGGHVLRYHTRPELMDGQNVAAHTWRTMTILHTLWPDVSKNCLLNMLYHDVAEAETGDMPATTKWKYPELNEIMARVERDYENSIGVGDTIYKVSEEERAMCDIADKLELVFHCYRLMQQGNTLANDVFLKGVNYLQEKHLGKPYFEPVQEILNALTSEYHKPPRLQVTLEQFSNL